MRVKKSSLVRMGITLPMLLLMVQPLRAQTSGGSSESDRLEKLERAVEQLQKRNAELEQEVSSLKKQTTSAVEPGAGGKRKKVVTYDGKTYVEKSVEEKPQVYVTPAGPEFKLTLGGFIQANFEGGDVSAFEGRFGLSALKDRFRLRRARISLTGDYLEQFDFKIEGDFEQSDAAITALSKVDVKTGKTTTGPSFPVRTFLLTGTLFPKPTSKSANGKRLLVWSSSRRTLNYSFPSGVFPLARSHLTGRSACKFGVNR